MKLQLEQNKKAKMLFVEAGETKQIYGVTVPPYVDIGSKVSSNLYSNITFDTLISRLHVFQLDYTHSRMTEQEKRENRWN